MRGQWGLITRAQALAAGMAPHRIDRLVRTGTWQSVRRGVYAETSYVLSLTSTQRRLLDDRAGSLRIAQPHVMSHHSAAHLLRLPVLNEPTRCTHVCRPGIVGAHLRHGVKHHLAPYHPRQVDEVEHIAVLDPARTALDIAREHGFLQGLVAADSAMRAGTTRAELEGAAAAMTHWPYVSVVRDVVLAASPLTDSIAETLGRDFVIELGYGRPQPQFGLSADGRTVWCDLRLGRHLFEIDGRIKLVPAALGGVATVSPADVLWEEKLRQDFVTGFKTGVSRLTWGDFFGRQRERALSRCRREYLDTCERFGSDIADLAPYRPRRPKPRPTLPDVPLMPRWDP